MAYRADIEIGVTGAARLKELQDRITRLSRAIDDANVKTLIDRNAVQSINSYSEAVGRATRNLQETAIQLDAAGKASGNYAQAINQLVTAIGQENAAQKIQNDLLKEEIELRRKAKLTAAGIRETTQYAGPIGPGAASAVALSSPLRGRTQQILDERKGTQELTAALAALEERRRQETNTALNEKAALVSLRLEREKERAIVLAGAAQQYAFPIGPNVRSTRRRFDLGRGDVSPERAERALIEKEKRALFEQEKQQLLELDRLRAANTQREVQRFAGLGKAIRGSLSSAAIGGAFPLLFGQSPQAAVGGAIGGLLGGAAGGFAGSLLGTALGEIEAAKARVKELSAELGFSSTQGKLLATAFELAGRNSEQLQAAITNIQGLGLSTTETASAIKIAVELSKEYGGSVEKIAQAFADTLESGKVSISTLNKFTGQGIPIQDELAKKLGVSKTKLLEMAKEGQISVQQLTNALVDMGRQAESTADKGATGFDRFTKAVAAIASAIAGAAGAILKNLIPALDTVLSKLASIINRATTALSLIADAQVGEASAALFKSGFTRGIFGGFAQSKGSIDDLTAGLKTLNPLLATNKDQLDKFAATANRYQKELQEYGGTVGEYAVGTAQVELTRVRNAISRRAKALGTPETAATISDINVPANLPPSGTGAGADKTAKAAERERQRVAEVVREQQLLTIERKRQYDYSARIFAAETAKDPILARRLQGEQQLVEWSVQTSKLLQNELSTSAQLEIVKARIAEKNLIIQKTEQDTARLYKEQRDNARRTIEGLQNELAIKNATTQAERDRLRIAYEMKLLQESNEYSPFELAAIKERKEKLAAPVLGADLIKQQVGALTDELVLLSNAGTQVTAGAKAMGAAFRDAFNGLVSGAMTGQEALAAFFQGVGNHFMDMAAQMIAKLIEIWVLQTALGFISGSVGSNSAMEFAGPGATGTNTFAYGAGVPKFADGGMVTRPTLGMIGEGGEAEYIIPASKMRGAMNRYAAGARGSAVIPAGDGGDGGTATMVAAPGAIDVRYTVERINSVDYVTADQFQQGMQQAAQQGAAQGEQRTLRRLQMSTSTRKRLGM